MLKKNLTTEVILNNRMRTPTGSCFRQSVLGVQLPPSQIEALEWQRAAKLFEQVNIPPDGFQEPCPILL